ncbi:MAG: polysaccharide deacetylase family protein [Bdellovibrionaceae bacterium]|nr:polysaccharide deacetylase family protein [Pseudobdellovibrionaceae bacterium]
MRILHLLSQMQPTGAEAYAMTLADWQTDHGHDVWFISDRLHSKTRQIFTPMPVHAAKGLERLRSTRRLKEFIRENKIQVIHSHSRAASKLAYWATFGTKTALVSTVHGRQPISLSKKLLDIYGEKVICVCENLVTKLTTKLSMNPRKLRLIRNPLNTAKLPFQETLNSELRIAWIGRFTGPKGERAREFLANVAPRLLEKFPKLHIDMIGGEESLLGPREAHPRIRIQSHLSNLDEELAKYRLVFAAGRIAMTALTRGIPTYAIGEYKSEGLVRTLNLSEVLRSNFGDIGDDGRATSEIDLQKLGDEVFTFLENSTAFPVSERAELRRQMLHEFDQENVCVKVLNTYKSSYFVKNHPNNIPVLMYHKTPDEDLNSPHRIFVTKNNFRKHLKFFKAHGFTTVHFADLEEFRSGRRDFAEFPKKPLVLTFDDGYVDNLTNAAPLLKEFRFKAVIYLLADHGLTMNSWDHDGKEPLQPLMNEAQKRELLKFNYEFGSHGFSHRKITEMNDAEAWEELTASKTKLENDFGVPVTTYAYTYGVTSPKAAELAELAGYNFGLNTDSGGLHIEEDPFAIFRINIFPEDGPAQLRKKTASWYRRYFYFKRGR